MQNHGLGLLLRLGRGINERSAGFAGGPPQELFQDTIFDLVRRGDLLGPRPLAARGRDARAAHALRRNQQLLPGPGDRSDIRRLQPDLTFAHPHAQRIGADAGLILSAHVADLAERRGHDQWPSRRMRVCINQQRSAGQLQMPGIREAQCRIFIESQRQPRGELQR